VVAEPGRVDVHQHLWPAEFVDQLRRRCRPPMLRGWTLHTSGEPPFEVDPADHDPIRRAALDPHLGRALVSLSAPLGIERLAQPESVPLLDAWHRGVLDLPGPFAGWASVTAVEPDLDALKGLLTGGFAGLQLPAGALATTAAVEQSAPVLRLCEELNRPVLVHPGPVSPTVAGRPAWWAPVVDYPAQLQAAWWSWHVAGRALFPQLRLCFAAGGGLAALHHERWTARTGRRFVVDRNVFVDTSSYGRQAVDALARVLGIDGVVLGSDRPYAEARDLQLGAAGQHAVDTVNPHRLLEGGNP
jgi:predicted TIM-barrel fold metal-dependent hydrolase